MTPTWLLHIKERSKTWLKEMKTHTFTCGICRETLPSKEKFKSNTCSHHRYCSGCISQYIDAKVQKYKNRSEVKCPSPRCTKYLDPLYCRSILPSNVYVSWCDALCESAVLGIPRVYCPCRDCSVLVLNECGGTSVTQSECPHCKRWFCFLCRTPWHEGYPCDVNRTRMNEDVLFNQLMVKKRWKRCPRCNQCVEMIGGCSQMTCRCGCLFCYLCGSKYSRNNRHTCIIGLTGVVLSSIYLALTKDRVGAAEVFNTVAMRV